MKHLSYIFSFFIFSCNAQEKPLFTKSLTIKYISGDESYQVQEMKFINNGKEVFGIITKPNLDALLSSEIKLDDKSIQLLNSFLKLVDEYRINCVENQISSFVQYYDISKDNDTLKIYKFCNWKNVTYDNIEDQIFGNYLKSLEKKKKDFNKSFSLKLIGKWNESDKLEYMNIDTPWNLTRLKAGEISDNYFEILKNQKAILHRGNKKIYYRYRIDVLNNQKYLAIFGDDNKNGEKFIYGHNFKITQISEKKINLIH